MVIILIAIANSYNNLFSMENNKKKNEKKTEAIFRCGKQIEKSTKLNCFQWNIWRVSRRC